MNIAAVSATVVEVLLVINPVIFKLIFVGPVIGIAGSIIGVVVDISILHARIAIGRNIAVAMIST